MRKRWENQDRNRKKVAILFFMTFLMKNFLYSEGFFNFAEFKLKSQLTKSTEDKNFLSADAGIRLKFSEADFRAFTSLPKTEISQIKSKGFISEKEELLDECRFGGGIFLFRESFPVSIKIGQNTYSKSVSKLKNPSPSVTANPLAKSFSFPVGTGAALPTFYSGKQPISYSLSAKSASKELPFLFGAEGFFTEEKNGAASVYAKINPARNIFVQAAFSGGNFFIDGSSKILKKNNSDFEADFFKVFLAELNFQSPLLKLNFHSGIQESPYDVNPFWFRLDGRTSFRSLLLNFSYFAIPTTKDSPKAAPLIGGSGQVCRTFEQAGINPQILFLFDDKNASSVRLGFSALENWKVTATNKPVQLNTMKLRSALGYESKVFDLRFDWTHANILLEGEPPTKSSKPDEYTSCSLSSKLHTKQGSISLSGSYTNYPQKSEKSAIKEIYSADLKFSLAKPGILTTAGMEITTKDKIRTAGEIKAGLTYSARSKYLRSSIKVCLCMPF